MTIAQIVEQYRVEHFMSQRDFAKKCGVSNAIISFLERGTRENGQPYLPRFNTIKKIARGMGMSPEELISRCDDFDIDITVGPEETPLMEDFVKELQNQSPDEAMLIRRIEDRDGRVVYEAHPFARRVMSEGSGCILKCPRRIGPGARRVEGPRQIRAEKEQNARKLYAIL